jgi:Putative  PD-(D/E)XK family member, (DUF4420)
MKTAIAIASLRSIVASASPPLPTESNDYHIATRLGPTFVARGRLGSAALLVPLASADGGVGRSGGGFALRAAPKVAFDHEGRSWHQPAAILDCTDDQVTDTFLVLIADLANRLEANPGEITWPNILAWVEEWQALLGRRALLSPEEQLGLWGELFVISMAAEPDALFAAWCGPEGESTDFLYDGAALEVKVSRRRHVHHVSQSQVTTPRGDLPAYLLSMWVGTEPVRGLSLPEVVNQLLDRLSDSVTFIRQLSRIGYSAQDRNEYSTRFLLLEAPRWYDVQDVPRVRAADAGISQLRYVVTLDVELSLDDARSQNLWAHFCAAEFRPERSEVGAV